MKLPAARGFTLIEVMVGATVALLVIAIVMGTFLTQQRSLQAMDLSREASSGSRDAMLSMQEAIAKAGYGIDPRYAFDFRSYNCTSLPCRDKINAPDEIVFVERDPNYFWAGTPTSPIQGCDTTAPCTGHAWSISEFTDATHIKINANAGDTFLYGQVVLMTCAKGSQPTMGTVAVTAKASAAGSLAITLLSAVAGNPYRTNVVTGADACFGAVYGAAGALAGVSMFLVNRYRYFLASFPGDSNPWLMLDRGLDYNQNGVLPENGADTADWIPIAHGVEDMQIAYLLRPNPTPPPNAPDNGADWIIGNAAGTFEEPIPDQSAANGSATYCAVGQVSCPLAGPTQSTVDTDPSRFTLCSANIRGVRVRLTIASLLKDLTVPNFAGDTYPVSIENRNDFTAITLGGLRRYPSSISVATPNMNSKDPFIF